MKIISKKGFAVGDMLPLGITIVVLGVGLGLGLQVLGDVQDDQLTGVSGCNATSTVSCGADYNATGDAVEGVAKFTSYLPTIALVIVVAIIIGILVNYLMMRNN